MPRPYTPPMAKMIELPPSLLLAKRGLTPEEAWGEAEDRLHEALPLLLLDKDGPTYIGSPFEGGYLAGFLMDPSKEGKAPEGWEEIEFEGCSGLMEEILEDRETSLAHLMEEARMLSLLVEEEPLDLARGGIPYLFLPAREAG